MKVAQQQVVLQFVHDGGANLQGINNYVIGQKFDVIKATEGRRILILQTALDRQVFAFDDVGQFGDVVIGQRQPLEFFQQADQRDHHRRRRA